MSSESELASVERRLVDLERELARLFHAQNQTADPFTDGPLTSVGTPPRVTGVVISESVGSFEIRWNSVAISNLKRYEIQIATDEAFSNITHQASTTQLHYAFVDGVPGTDYHVRVRAINVNNAAGAWSSDISTVPPVQTGDVEPDAVNLVEFVFPSTFTQVDNNVGWVTIGTVSITVEDVLPVIHCWSKYRIGVNNLVPFTTGPPFFLPILGTSAMQILVTKADLTTETLPLSDVNHVFALNDTMTVPKSIIPSREGTYTYEFQLRADAWQSGHVTAAGDVLLIQTRNSDGT